MEDTDNFRNELKKKLLEKCIKRFMSFSTSLDKKLYNKNNVDNTYIALICNIESSYNNNNKGANPKNLRLRYILPPYSRLEC